MPAHPEAPGGQGDDPSRSDLALHARALREDWAMGPGVRGDVLRAAYRMVRRKGADARARVAAMRVLIAAGGLNIRQQALDLRREELAARRREDDVPTARDLVAEMQREAEAYDREHGGEREAGGDQGGAGPLPG